MDITADPEVFIESREGDSVIYNRPCDGKRWRVTGTCDKRGFCVIGAVVQSPEGENVVVESVEQLNELATAWGREGHIQTAENLDVPTGIGYDNNCCPLVVEELE